ncbi:MAG: hypothetical protein KA479_00595 [Saprospiraceae bacterium]|nr:hypothetical protein [Saprospiraceae bacterium]
MSDKSNTTNRINHWYSQTGLFGLALGIQIILCLVSLHTVYFWDSIQFGSRHASHFYTGGGWWLPNCINSGNPPLLGFIVSSAWKWFGRELWVSHIITWPFLFLNLGLLAAIGRRLQPTLWGWLPLIWIAVPVYAAQSTLVSPDIMLITGLLLVLFGWSTGNRYAILGGSLLLSIVSLRGFIVLLGVFLWWLIDPRQRPKLWLLIPGITMALVYYLIHYLELGWAFVPEKSPWANSFSSSGVSGLPRQIIVFFWRLVDHGFGFLWLGLGFLMVKAGKLCWRKPETHFLLTMIFLFASLAIGFSALNMHRYLLPVFLGATILFFTLSVDYRLLRWLILAGLFSGNLWIYPDRIAQGWDATLAWLPWTHHRQIVLNKMTQDLIPPGQVASAFPNLGPLDELDLSGNTSSFLPLNQLQRAPYFFYSTVFNDLTDKELALLKTWPKIHQSGTWPIQVILYKNPLYDGS